MGSVSQSFTSNNHIRIQRGLAFGLIIVAALFAFEIFNYSTTVFALSDLLGDLKFAGIKWATILAIAFCCIDFAGIARLFTPESGADEPKEVWYLFGAWLLAATMNAILTWWGVAMAISGHSLQSSRVMDAKTLTTIVPVFVAMMVWVIRILIIGTLSVAGERMIWGGGRESSPNSYRRSPIGSGSHSSQPSTPSGSIAPRPLSARPAAMEASSGREPTYHSM